MIAAGRKQGKNSIEELGLVNQGVALSLDEIQEKANYILGQEGSRLCIIDKIEQEGKAYRVYAKKTFVLLVTQQFNSSVYLYLGAIQGF
jgi:hypothetical protein